MVFIWVSKLHYKSWQRECKKISKVKYNFGTLSKPENLLEMVMGQVIALSGIAYTYLVTIYWVLKTCQTLLSFLLSPPGILRTPLWGRYYYFQFSGKSYALPKVTQLVSGLGLKPTQSQFKKCGLTHHFTRLASPDTPKQWLYKMWNI